MTNKERWSLLLSDVRPTIQDSAKQVVPTKQDEWRSAFEIDYDRVVFSSSFRRLSKKTQVHPFAQIDFVHNRLTHSIEVATLGRSLALRIAQFVQSNGEMPEGRTLFDFINIISAACLAHDIGNPPFGHAGEDAIRAWSQRMIYNISMDDWMYFDGNAQTFRMLSNPCPRPRQYFRLTYATLASIIKYPWIVGSNSQNRKKGNVFLTELPFFKEMESTLGLAISSGKYARHPFAYLVEVADDISYNMMDLEDAATMRILRQEDVAKMYKEIIGDAYQVGAENTLPQLRSYAISVLCDSAIKVFKEHYQDILSGVYEGELKQNFSQQQIDALKTIKDTYSTIFGEEKKVMTEVACYSIMDKILTRYMDMAGALADTRDYTIMTDRDKKLAEMTWDKDYLRVNKDKSTMWWFHAVTDYIVGMTDNYAKEVADLF